MSRLFGEAQLDLLAQKVYDLLERVGMKVDSEVVTAALRTKGCREGADGRVRFPRGALSELVGVQESRLVAAQQAGPSPPKPPTPRGPAPVLMGCAFGPGPTKYYDYARGHEGPMTTQTFVEMVKFADATPEIGRVHPGFRQDAEARVEGVESVILGLKLSKKTTGNDAVLPKQVPYLVEISEIVTGRRGDTSYLCGSQCMTPPLRLGHRAAEEIVERARCGVRQYYVATMPMVGVSAPVTLAGTVVVGSAEVLGGLMAAFAVNPDAQLNGTSAATAMDMATGNAAMNTPETALVDAGVKELFDGRFGGHVSAHVRYAPSAKVPGLQAVYENFYGMAAATELLGSRPTYAGNGNLDLGAVGSPVQAMLDIEVRRSLSYLGQSLDVDAESIPLDTICECVLEGRSFLDTPHTLRHFREMWTPQVFLRRTLGQDWNGSERHILDRCEQMVRANLARYEPPEWPAEALRALDDVLARAKVALA